MKSLILSDLHICNDFFRSQYYLSKYKRILEDNIKQDYDIVLISGDVFQHNIMHSDLNPFELLNYFFNGKKVIFCLGNHEFAFQLYDNVLKYWKQKQNEYKNNNVFCLDILKSVQIDDFNFVGNVFWYDFSLNKNQLLMNGEIIENWLDASIKNFDPIKYNKKCQNDILNHLLKNKKNILVTHMVTHWSLNTFSIQDEFSALNAYSGNYDFLKDIKDEYPVEYVICGHTHRREIKEIHNIKCINIGNDYYFRKNKIENIIIDL